MGLTFLPYIMTDAVLKFGARSGAHSWVRKALNIGVDGDQTGKPLQITHIAHLNIQRELIFPGL